MEPYTLKQQLRVALTMFQTWDHIPSEEQFSEEYEEMTPLDELIISKWEGWSEDYIKDLIFDDYFKEGAQD